MGFLSSLLGMVGVGQPTVTAEIEGKKAFGRGAIVRGHVTVTGGSRELPVSGVEVAVVKLEEEDDMTNRDRVAEVSLPMGGLELAPEASFTIPFEIQIPKDADPTGGDTKWQVVASADVPGWDPEAEIDVKIHDEDDDAAGESLEEHFLIEHERSFRHSSVRGDFRVHRLPDGFVTQWNDGGLVCREADGSERWRLHDFGRTLAVHPDGDRIIAADGQKNVAFIDPVTGEVGDPVAVGAYVDGLAFLGDGSAIVAAATERVLILDPETAALKKKIRKLDDGRDDPSELYVSSVAAVPGTNRFYVADPNANRVTLVSGKSLKAKKSVEVYNAHDLRLGEDGETLLVDGHDDVAILDPKLKLTANFDVPGQKGVRQIGETEYSCEHFKTNATLSPDGSRIVVNDCSGLLWVVGTDGEPIRAFTRDILDHVEFATWLDDERIVAITNDGRVHGVTVDGLETSFSEEDL